MPLGDPELRYATNTFDADGVETDFEVSFIGGYISAPHVKCISVLIDADTGLVSDTQTHPVEIISSDANSATVRVAPAVADGRTVVIYRDTAKTSMLVNYSDGSVLTRANLDLANRQLLMIIQEILDEVSGNSLSVADAVSTVINLNDIVTQIYNEVIQILASGGILIVSPKVFTFEGDGLATDFVLDGADVLDPAFYDTYVDGLGLSPGTEFDVVAGDPGTMVLRFPEALSDGAKGFAVLRGHTQPQAEPPVSSLRIPMFTTDSTLLFITAQYEYGLIRSTAPTAAVYKVPEIPAGPDEMGTGSYVSITQRGAGQVTVEADTIGVELVVPAGFLPKTRAEGSTISLTCEYGEGNVWLVSGDLAEDV